MYYCCTTGQYFGSTFVYTLQSGLQTKVAEIYIFGIRWKVEILIKWFFRNEQCFPSASFFTRFVSTSLSTRDHPSWSKTSHLRPHLFFIQVRSLRLKFLVPSICRSLGPVHHHSNDAICCSTSIFSPLLFTRSFRTCLSTASVSIRSWKWPGSCSS